METGGASLLLGECESDAGVRGDVKLEVIQRHHFDPFLLGAVVDFGENEVYLCCDRGFPAVMSACHDVGLIRLDGDVRDFKLELTTNAITSVFFLIFLLVLVVMQL